MRRFVGAVVTSLVVMACSGAGSEVGDPPPDCVTGATVGCTCMDGRLGTTLCVAGRPSGCECKTVMTEADASAEDAGTCTTRQWWRDFDGDGYGAGDPVEACEQPVGFVEGGDTDCGPEDARAHPGQTEYYAAAITGLRSASTTAFDFDCSRSTEMVAVSATCSSVPCGAFWASDPPACGESGSWVLTCTRGAQCIIRTTETRVQACR